MGGLIPRQDMKNYVAEEMETVDMSIEIGLVVR